MIDYIDHGSWIPEDNNVLFHLDPGHGGMIDGKYTTAPAKMFDHGDFIFYEGLFNRHIVIKLSEILRGSSYNYILSTTSNLDISLPIRIQRSRNYYKLYKNMHHIFLSIHGNAAGIESAHGIEIYTSPGETQSDKIAAYYYKRLKTLGWKMRTDYSDGDPDKESKFYVLTKTPMPAILLELGFFTNKNEALLMMQEDIQWKIANLIADGCRDIVNIFYKQK